MSKTKSRLVYKTELHGAALWEAIKVAVFKKARKCGHERMIQLQDEQKKVRILMTLRPNKESIVGVDCIVEVLEDERE